MEDGLEEGWYGRCKRKAGIRTAGETESCVENRLMVLNLRSWLMGAVFAQTWARLEIFLHR